MIIPALKHIIAVNATALKSGGALAILQQFVSHIHDDKTYYIFISEEVSLTVNDALNIHLIRMNKTRAINRVLWDWFGLKRWFKLRQLVPDVVVSLQNTSIASNKQAKKIIYLHQGISLHDKRWSFLKPGERVLAFYKYIYPFFIFFHANKNTQFVVQTQWMKKILCSKFGRDEKKVYVIKPDISQIAVESINSIDLPHKYNLFYPATNMPFKNHKELIYALNEIKKCSQDFSLIALYLTIEKNEELAELITRFKLEEQIYFLGQLTYDEVLIYYKSCTTVVFPSYIESFGLPLVEAAKFGKPLVVLDEEYSREVISGYSGVLFAAKKSPIAWKDAILQSLKMNQKTESYSPEYDTNWDCFFKLMDKDASI